MLNIKGELMQGQYKVCGPNHIHGPSLCPRLKISDANILFQHSHASNITNASFEKKIITI